MKKAAALISSLMVIFLFNASTHAQTLTVGTSQGQQGDTLAIPITFSNDLNNVVAMQFDITFDSSLVNITDASAGSALDGTSFSLSTSEPAAETRRIIITPPVQSPIPIVPEGEIAVISVYLAGTPGSTATLTLQNVVMSDGNGDPVCPVLHNGAITITSKDDILGTWPSGVYYRDSETGSWVKMSSPANLVAAGDIDADSIDDLIGVWNSGLWVKYFSSGSWAKFSSSLPSDIDAGLLRGGA